MVAGPSSPTGEASKPDAERDDELVGVPASKPALGEATSLPGSIPTSRGGGIRSEGDVTAMFDEIAPDYDRLNTIMTLGLDRRWRAAAVAASGLGPGDSAVDVAAGTGKLAAALAARVGPFGHVAAVDLSPGMVARGRAATDDLVQLEYCVGNALALPFEEGRFDVATIAFGLRNLADFEAGFREMRRVVKPGGRVVCLELTIPRPRWWAKVQHAAFRRLAPLAGSIAGHRQIYDYLPASLDGFPDADELAQVMASAGLVAVTIRRLGLGAVALHVGRVPTP
jgi:demethylmenaquinone methyltransferase/2-methoxy-6-polyprenyl-1,4-benzoquinol methylase